MGIAASKYIREYLKEVRSQWTLDQREEPALWLSDYRPHHPVKKRLLREMAREYAEAAGLDHRVTPHVWRHTCATHLVANGSNLTYVQRLLSHRRLDTTEISRGLPWRT